jgi:3-deoxy-7-phosphoheptulonate synthase
MAAMWIALTNDADEATVRRELQGLGLWATPAADGGEVTGLFVAEQSQAVDDAAIRAIPGVAAVSRPKSATPQLDRQAGRDVTVAGWTFPADPADTGLPLLIAGPCAVESRDQVAAVAAAAARHGARWLRGGAFKPRTSPYSFSGHGESALRWLREAADAHDMAVVTEAMGESHVDLVAGYADIVQVGSRNMQNFALLAAVGASGKPVLLKRGMAATIADWFASAEHLLAAGAGPVVFCERGVTGFDPTTRNLLDLAAVAQLRHVHRLPVVVDPSHATGRRDLIAPLARAGIAAGGHGVVVEVHPDAREALSDGPQSLSFGELAGVASAIGLPAAPRTPPPTRPIPHPESPAARV